MIYSSNAEWTKIGKSKDVGGYPDTKGFAEAICDRLLEDYGVGTNGCEIRGHCIRTWVEEEKESEK